MQCYYITTPIYYVNGNPHIGHSYTNVIADIIARYHNMNNMHMHFLTGTDEHGEKVMQAAGGIDKVQSFVDSVSEKFKDLAKAYEITNTDFIRTTDKKHKDAVVSFWNKLQEKGLIYKADYEGWYCLRDESFYKEEELIDGKSPSGGEVEWKKEPSYFFRLKNFQEKLLKFYRDNPDFIYPKSRMNEVISFVEFGLEDISISRKDMQWGVKVPGNESHSIYVWIDALINYVSAAGYPNMSKYWPANCHVIGKDILRFHAVYWPALLMAAGLELPKKIAVHGWWTNEGQKMSKSVGNTIDPFELKEKYGSDYVRYFFAKNMVFGNDSNFSHAGLVKLINGQLVNKIGNLLQRTLVFLFSFHARKVPHPQHGWRKEEVILKSEGLARELSNGIENYKFHEVIDFILSVADSANQYLDTKAPWKSDDDEYKGHVVYVALESVRKIAIALIPFTPHGANKMLDILNINKNHRDMTHLTSDYSLHPGFHLNKPSIVFNRLR